MLVRKEKESTAANSFIHFLEGKKSKSCFAPPEWASQ